MKVMLDSSSSARPQNQHIEPCVRTNKKTITVICERQRRAQQTNAVGGVLRGARA